MGLKTLFIISISTARMIFPHLPILPDMQPGEAPLEVKAVSRSISMNIESPKRTAEVPSAVVNVPEGLKVGPSVKLVVEYPKAPTTDPKAKPAEASKVVTKTYWGSADSIPAGQPKVEETSTTSAASPDAAQPASIAYWPLGIYKEKLPGDDSKLAGNYSLATNYCGDASVTIREEQEFLAPVSISDLPPTLDPEKPFKISWAKIPRALGYIVNAIGGDEKQTIIWTSSSDLSVSFSVEANALDKTTVESYLKKKILLPPDATSCTIPVGVFHGDGNAIVTVTAIGSDTVQAGTDIDTQVIVRSSASIPLNIGAPVKVAM